MLDIDKIFEDFDEEEYSYDLELTDEDFVNFLQEHNIYEKFIENFDPYDNLIVKSKDDYCKSVRNYFKKTDYIWAAFSFPKTNEGIAHWNKYDKIWIINSRKLF